MLVIEDPGCICAEECAAGVEAKSGYPRENVTAGGVVEQCIESCDRVSVLGGEAFEGQIYKRGQSADGVRGDVSIKVDPEDFAQIGKSNGERTGVWGGCLSGCDSGLSLGLVCLGCLSLSRLGLSCLSLSRLIFVLVSRVTIPVVFCKGWI